MFGREPHTPLTFKYADLVQDSSSVETFGKAYRSIQAEMKRNKDEGVTMSGIKKGSWVLVRYHPKEGKCKLAPKWKGPLQVTEVEDRVVILQDERRVHKSDVKMVSAKLRETSEWVEDLLPGNEFSEVKKVVGRREDAGEVQYKVRWKGCHKDADSWKKLGDLNCDPLVQEFEERLKKKKEKQNSPPKEGVREVLDERMMGWEPVERTMGTRT
jgi:hypothetical protein